ncbi:response regulator [Desulfobotulus mexicanus]|uniref:Response regulator n=1 Tax=Desulfobotulus mexicanus TaxID=2586642 RepID=A0A5Q4VIL2_9BACT|nr:response regulator [Desulfobotulus mexicanus]TYT76082.1 response regulator [Desulfobotulus mexicanus]
MTILSLFSVRYAGSESLVDDLCQKTRSRIFRDTDIIERCSLRHHIKPAILKKALYSGTSVFNNFTHEKEYATACLRATLADLLETEGQIFTGHTALLLPFSLSHVLRIHITAGRRWRIMQAKAMGTTEKEAEEDIRRHDTITALWTRHLWKKPSMDKDHFHMILTMDKAENPLEEILETMTQPRHQITKEGRWIMEDFRLRTRVELELNLAGHDVEVDVFQGRVRLTIEKKFPHPSKLANELHSIVSASPGVQEVEICIGPVSTDARNYHRYDAAVACKVLLVDDEKEFVQTLSERLRMREYPSHAVFSGKEALDLLETDAPDVMVLDLMMPGINGFEVLRRTRQKYPDIEIIILSGHGSETDRQRCMDMGAFACLQKPADINELKATINKAHARILKRRETP